MEPKNSIIFIENGELSKIKKALNQWIELYSDNLDSGLIFKITKAPNDKIVIRIVSEIENELFNYLINYLQYPVGIDYNIKIEGFTKLKDDKLYPKNLLNKYALIFIPESDNDYDFVLGITESNESFKVDFGGTFKKENHSKKYYSPTIDNEYNTLEIIKHSKKKVQLKQNKSQSEKFNSRFTIISLIFIVLSLFFGFLTYGTPNFILLVKILSFGLFFWVMLEHEQFDKNSVFFKLLFLCAGFALLGYFFSNQYNDLSGFWFRATRLGLLFLVIDKILRTVYIQIYNRTPIFDKSAEKSADQWYSFFLLIAVIFTSFII